MKPVFILLPSAIICAVVFLFGCSNRVAQFDKRWLQPVKVTDSSDMLNEQVHLFKWQNTIIGLYGDKETKCLLMKNNNSWTEASFSGVSTEYLQGYPSIDQFNDTILFGQSCWEEGRITMNVLVSHMANDLKVRDTIERNWSVDKTALFGKDDPNIKLTMPGKRYCVGMDIGIINGSDLYIPYHVEGQKVTQWGKKYMTENGPASSGVFHSSDSGATWQTERISDIVAEWPSVLRTENFYYYISPRGITPGYELWFSRKPVNGSSWDKQETLSKTFAFGMGGYYAAVGEGDTAHICWMDRRHNKWRFNLEGPTIENDDIAYCHRKDSGSDWSKDVILSKGVLYSYAPSMSVEGNNVVVVWSGIQTAGNVHTEYDPNDIFYVTSKDGGNTWSKPLKVTDGARGGVISGKPQVMLLSGAIHLFYIQGTLENPKQLSPGLTKLNRQPWPIYYTQRPFPN